MAVILGHSLLVFISLKMVSCFLIKNCFNAFFFVGFSVSLIAFTTMALLTIMEFSVYQDTWMKYEYEVDKDFSR